MPEPFHGVTVEVISEGEKLNFYQDPDEDPSNLSPRTRQQYVEAVTDAIFKVRILLTDAFPLYSLRLDDGVRLSINYDGQQLAWYIDLSARQILLSWGRGQPAEHTFARISRYCNDSQRWTIGETTFGALSTSDTAPSVAKVKDLGLIKVTIHRVYRTKRALPLHTRTDKLEKPIVEVSEKTLKGKAIANTVRTANEVPSTGPPPTTWDTESMDGVEGEPLTFNILYRSKHNLQMLGCIPRTPSPQSDAIVVISDDTSREQKVRELRAQLALLEGAGSVKAEGASSRATVKRELENAENAGSRKRSRNSGPIETIDLTDD